MSHTCEFCESPLVAEVPENVALLDHIRGSPECNEQYAYMLDNLRASWTVSMSGG